MKTTSVHRAMSGLPSDASVDDPSPWLAGLTPSQFMRRHWQKKPLLVRRAWADGGTPITRTMLFDLAAQDGVESRLVTRFDAGWQVTPGPLKRRQLPPPKTRGWTLLVQGVDLHLDAAHRWLRPFRFIPDARLDDLMVSYASDGGGVGPHVDSYDVFLLQVHGARRWRIGPVRLPQLVDGLPLKILANFEPVHDWLLQPGDLLYVPPGWGHDGVAEGGDCMTASVGYRAPARSRLAIDLIQRLIDANDEPDADPIYRDPTQPATDRPGEVPPALQSFAERSVAHWLGNPVAFRAAMRMALGEVLTDPKPGAWFESADSAAGAVPVTGAVALDRRSRMVYDDKRVYLTGEAYSVSGRDATLLKRLADRRLLSAADRLRLSTAAAEAVGDWLAHGWLVCVESSINLGDLNVR